MNLEFVEKKVVKSYDNEGAMQTVKAMMKRGEQLNVKFYTNKDNYPCAWIESKKIQGFCLILNQEGLSWLRTYLETGEAEDFGFNPNSVTAYGEGEDKDFQLSIFKQLILAGKALQFVPTFREYGAKITASAFFRIGYNDMVCPPTSTFSVYNVITSPKEIVIMEEAEHYVYPEHWSQALQWIYSKQGM